MIELLELTVLLFFFSHLWILVDIFSLDLFRLCLILREVFVLILFYRHLIMNSLFMHLFVYFV